MNNPTAEQVRWILDLFKGRSCEQIQAVFDSGFLSILFQANIAEIDKQEFEQVCGFPGIPTVSDIFWLKVNGVVRRFRLFFRVESLTSVRETVVRFGYKIPDSYECLEAFRQRFPKSDGAGKVCSPCVLPTHTRYQALIGSSEQNWQMTSYDTSTHPGTCRWLFEAVERKMAI
jgi:hypothetical protein